MEVSYYIHSISILLGLLVLHHRILIRRLNVSLVALYSSLVKPSTEQKSQTWSTTSKANPQRAAADSIMPSYVDRELDLVSGIIGSR